jgi:hypothetical protein
MHNGDAIRRMRMGISLARRTMGCPARVANADQAIQRLPVEQGFKMKEFARGAASINHAIMNGGDSRAVIATIFKTLQRFHNDGRSLPVANNTDDSTHISFPNLSSCALH